MTAKKPVTPVQTAPATPAKGKQPAAAAAKPQGKTAVKPQPAAAKPAAPSAKAALPAAKPAAPPAPPKGKKAAAPAPAQPLADLAGDADFADLVADAEVAADDADAKAKAKPLRMKVSRAKERALMREFGLEEATLTEEEVVKRRQELKTLIKMGKTRGFLTHQEISDHLPEKLVDNEILEAIVSMLNDMGIAVYEQAPDAATLLISGSNTATATDEEAEEAAEAALSTVDSEFGRTTDPVRMYMREMGTVELLTREGEIEIAKRIEGGL
ncbi:MAG TPA: RNA polymerase sigma factor region1.1 domain-containing protein, partial [Rubrivivax sp.]|nr:RNA polymerase sigma factor region1.1 domain-containing protein [Rubrivivax sp.]